MDKQIFEIPIVLTLHGKVKIRAESKELAEQKASELKTRELRRYFKEEFAFSGLGTRHEVDDDPVELLEEAHGEENENDVPSDGGA